ncbi:MAG TPA: MBL fold metallo-hydrolase [Chloroflexota bacterium]|nr:MBL fold metallo-hydrolase [Chloroflexota bacterium]
MAAEYVATRRVGEARVTVIHDATDLWIPKWQAPEAEWRRAIPEADGAGEMSFDMSVLHVALGGASVLVDLGYGDAPERYMKRVPYWRSPGIEAGLATIGVRPEDVTHVVITHAHGDHIMGATIGRNDAVARFPRTRHLIQRIETATKPAPEWVSAPEKDQLGALEGLGLLDLVDGDVEVVPGIDMLHAPGESPGHSVVRVRSADAVFYCLGDLFHHVAEVENLAWLPAGRDSIASANSRRRFIDLAIESNALLTFTHCPFSCWGRIIRDGTRQRWVHDVQS